jgi:homocysteine S-methyltransferase
MTPVVVLDGGMGTELTARGHDLSDRLWSARVLLADPGAIEDVHLAYFEAGANVATTASYQASIDGFAEVGLGREAALELIRSSVVLARRARDRADAAHGPNGRRIAGSVGPYGALLADGSEYRGDYEPGPAALADFHRPRMEALLDAGADLLAIETIPSIREAEVLVRLVEELDTPAWLSFSGRDAGTIADGEPIESAIALAADGRFVAVGVNCTPPRHIPGLLTRAATVTDDPLIAYPNGGDRWDATERRWVSTAGDGFDPETVAGWTALGATWLGGCCGTGPAEIAALVDALRHRPTSEPEDRP